MNRQRTFAATLSNRNLKADLAVFGFYFWRLLAGLNVI